MTKVRLVNTTRDGWVLKWREGRSARQRNCHGKTQRARETERRKLEESLNATREDASWQEFWELYFHDHLSHRSDSHKAKSKMMHRRVRAASGRKDLRCRDISRHLILQIQSDMQSADVEQSTTNSSMATLWAMISWGQDNELIPDFSRPRRRVGKREKQTSKSRGRALTDAEVDRLVDAIPGCVKSFEDSDEFIRAVHVMRLTGMRLSEAWWLSWTPQPGAHYVVDLGSESASIEFSDVQKSGISSTVPMTNEAIAYFRRIGNPFLLDESNPWICRTTGAKGPHKTPGRLGRVIAAAGKSAGIVVKTFHKSTGEKIKYASAHDLRRTFATNLQRDLSYAERRVLTRHADIKTLMDHYEDAPTPVLIAKLRGG